MHCSGLHSDRPQGTLIGNQVTRVLGEGDCVSLEWVTAGEVTWQAFVLSSRKGHLKSPAWENREVRPLGRDAGMVAVVAGMAGRDT